MSEMERQAHELEGDGVCDMYSILIPSIPQLRIDENEYLIADGGYARANIKANDTVTWQNITFEGIPLQIEGVGQSSEGEKSRPTFTMANPDGAFSTLIRDGALDSAYIIRFRVLRADVEADLPEYERQTWRISRVSSLTREQVSLELRDQLDGQFFKVPGRRFMPPEFQQVTLQ